MTDLHRYGLDACLKDLRSTQRTFAAVADIVGEYGEARRVVADCDENLRTVCSAAS